MSKKTVAILLSTYNGERYLKELLDSIVSQTYTNINIIIRDDGSKDSTCEIIQRYCKIYNNISFHNGVNLGSAKSFLELLKIAPDSDYYAFADQDDVWLPNKIEKGIELLETHKAHLYHSNYHMTDGELNPIQTPQKANIQTIGEAAIVFPCTGCTMIVSKKVRDLVNSYQPDYIVMHDSWIFKIAIAICQPIVFDTRSFILYRQHGNNVLGGIEPNIVKRFISRLRSLFKSERIRSKEIIELLKGYESVMDPETKDIINMLAHYKNKSFLKRLHIAFDPHLVSPLKSKIYCLDYLLF